MPPHSGSFVAGGALFLVSVAGARHDGTIIHEQSLVSTYVVCKGEGSTRLEERELEPPAAGEILLRVRASGLCGTDIWKLASGTARPGEVLGHEIVGVVEQVGAGLETFRAGMRVVVPHHVPCGECELCLRGSETKCAGFLVNLLHPGGFGERLIVRERAARMAARIVPDAVSDEAAVFLEPAACVLRGIHRAGLPPASAGPPRVIVLGAGSMGLLHVLVLRALHPEAWIAVVDPVADRLRLAKHIGANVGLSPPEVPADGSIPWPDPSRAAVEIITGGRKADAVFDTVGGARRLDDALPFLREGGTAVLFAHAPAEERAGFDLNALFKSEKRVVGTYSGALREQAEVFDLIVSGRLDASPLVTHRLPLSAFDEGLALVRDRKALKVLFTPSTGGGP